MIKKIFIIYILFLLFFTACSNKPKEKTNLAIQPLEYTDQNMLDFLKTEIKNAYGFNVYILENKVLPENSITTFKGKRYNASILLDELQNLKTDTIDYIIGVTDKDICINKYDNYGRIQKPESKYRDFGIFGLGFCPGDACIISQKRLQSSTVLTKERMKKVSIHEIGHNLGLSHCTASNECVMRSAAEKLSTVDEESSDLCLNCQSKINYK